MWIFVVTILFSIIFTWLAIKLANHFKIVDTPHEPRKKHKKSIPLLGGVAIFTAFWLVAGYIIFTTGFGKNLPVDKLISVFLGSVVLLIVGIVDDIRPLPAKIRFGLSAVAVIIAISGGVGIEKITNPFGGIWYIDLIRVYNWPILANLLVFVWIMGMTYTTKVLDGLDGLATGVSTIAAIMIFFIASGARWHQPDVALFALIFAGACLGFLFFNFNPARIFLGESGSLFLGYMLGVMSVISGGKFATALLVMAVPILDLLWVIVARVRRGQKLSQGDREHLHFRLVDAGMSERMTVIFLYAVAILFGLATLFLQSQGKVIVLFLLLILVIIIERTVNKFKIYGKKS